jgi:YD repeat-containing protein
MASRRGWSCKLARAGLTISPSACPRSWKSGQCSLAFLLLAFLLWLSPGLALRGDHFALTFPTARADNVQYAYDALGRVVEAVNTSTGQVAEYAYDPAGNIAAIQTVAIGTLSIAGFSTTQGPSGTQIIIYGTGFNTTAGANTVWFNGVQATVVSATQTQLVVIVPTGATTGLVRVSTSPGSTTSATAFALIPLDDINVVVPIPRVGAANTKFTVVAANNAPTIGGFSPTVGAPGTAVTVTGTNFQPLANDRVQFNQYQAAVTSATGASIAAIVPPNTSSGKIQVTTPYGTAVSAADFIIPPSGYAVSSIGTSGRIPADGSANTVALSTASKIAVELFDGVAGQYLTLGISNDTIASATVSIIDPDGNTLVSGTVTPSTPAIQLPRLVDTGTYSIVIDPGSNTGSLTLAVAPPLTGTLTVGGATLPLTISPAGRRALVSFSGTAGQYLTLSASSVTLPAGTLTIISPDGTILVSGSIGAGALRPLLPSTGTYAAFLNPAGAVGGNITLTLALTPAPTLHVNPVSYDTLTITDGNPHNLLFNATPGQNYTLAMCWCSTQVTSASLQIVGPDGSVVASATPTTFFTSLSSGPLKAPGTYAVVVQIPGNANTVPLEFSLTTPVVATLSVNAATPVTTSYDAQGMLLNFSELEGEQLSLGIQENCSNSNFDYYNSTIKLLKSDGSVVQSGVFKATQGCSSGGYAGGALLNFGPLPTGGSYTVEIDVGDFFDRGMLTFQLYDWDETNWATGALTVNGGSQSEALTQPQPGVQLTFNASAGQSLKLTIQETSTLTNPALQLFAPDGTDASTLMSGTSSSPCSSPCAAIQTTSVSPSQTGTYTLLVTPANSSYGSGTLTFQLDTQ